MGTAGAGFHVKASKAADPAAVVEPYKTYQNASYGTGGIALRNRGRGVLHVSGVTGPVQDAYLYWAILFDTATPATSLSHVMLRPITFPLFDFLEVPLTGTLLGISADPAWGSTGGAVYRAQVPKWIVQGNGAYEVTLAKGSSGLTDGSDPWVSYKFPLAEGASLVIIGTGNYTVGIYDTGFTATEFCATTLTYTLNLPAPYTSDALWDNIGADGQAGHSRDDDAATSLETTVINGVDISGPGALDNDSDWNGSAGLPLPQLWDDTGHDIASAFTVADPAPTTAAISFASHGDCLVTVANVLAVR
jgi:hypothetical protein